MDFILIYTKGCRVTHLYFKFNVNLKAPVITIPHAYNGRSKASQVLSLKHPSRKCCFKRVSNKLNKMSSLGFYWHKKRPVQTDEDD